MINNKGPDIDPCGTTVDLFIEEDLKRSIFTHCFLFDKLCFFKFVDVLLEPKKIVCPMILLIIYWMYRTLSTNPGRQQMVYSQYQYVF